MRQASSQELQSYRPEGGQTCSALRVPEPGGYFVFKHKHYVPILKGKRAEFPALGSLNSKKHITPLIEAVPAAAANVIPQRMANQWPKDKPYFIDFLFLDDPDNLEVPATEQHPVRVCFAEVEQQEEFAIPVTGLSRSPGYQSAIQQVVTEQERGSFSG